MKLKMKYLRHPLRTAANAGNLAARYVGIRNFADRSARHFHGDPRYDLANVSRGLTSRAIDAGDDTELLARICTAYNKAVQHEQVTPPAYRAHPWWQQVRQTSLGPVIHALRSRDIGALAGMYRNFFRDPCATGLIGTPYGMSRIYFGRSAGNMYHRAFLGDALYTIDYWTAQTGGRFPLHALAGPGIGNPFGIVIDGTLIKTGAAYQHYSAQWICSSLGSSPGVVAEIGGGFGGMAYYLLRDRPGVAYLDFDVPESIALASYYLMKAFPHLNFLLYGENAPAKGSPRPDVMLMPTFALEKLPGRSVDVVFSSHAISDISRDAIGEYLKAIAHIARRAFLCAGNAHGARLISHLAAGSRIFRDAESRSSEWNMHRHPNAEEVECLYHVGPN
jgi:hypothetical protein